MPREYVKSIGVSLILTSLLLLYAQLDGVVFGVSVAHGPFRSFSDFVFFFLLGSGVIMSAWSRLSGNPETTFQVENKDVMDDRIVTALMRVGQLGMLSSLGILILLWFGPGSNRPADGLFVIPASILLVMVFFVSFIFWSLARPRS